MASKEKMDQAMALISKLDDAQIDELLKLAEQKREEGVFGQELSADELEAAAGGNLTDTIEDKIISIITKDDDPNNCTQSDKRNIYGGSGFANCAATVESGSICSSNDACYSQAVNYQGMSCRLFDCTKAWR